MIDQTLLSVTSAPLLIDPFGAAPMPISPQGPQSPLLNPSSAQSTSGNAQGLDPRLYTGRVIVSYPKGMMPAGIQALANNSGMKTSSIASASDFQPGLLRVAQVLQQSAAVRFDELDTMIVNDPRQLQGLSPASAGSAPMPKVSPERYLFFANLGPPAGVGGVSPGDLKALMDSLQQLLQRMGSGTSPGQPGTGPVKPADASSSPSKGPFQDSNTTTWGLQAVQAVSSSFTGKGVRVAVIDSGIDQNHPDFANRAAGLTTATFVNESVQDIDGHGTHVAGTIGGLRNGTFNYGVAPDVALFIAKVIGPDQFGRRVAMDGDVVNAILWAIQNKCHIANMSLSAPVAQGEPFPDGMEQMAQNALASGLLLIAAAGNDSGLPSGGPFSARQNPPAAVGHPANCPHILAVGALQPNLSVSLYSNGGQSNPANGQVDLAGPGDMVVSSWPLNVPAPLSGRQGFNVDSGTSMATPHVVGLAALLSQSLGVVGGLPLWQALPAHNLISVDDLGLDRRDVGFGMPLAAQ
jgi:subtilisin family serine protease